MAQLYAKGICLERDSSILVDDGSLRRERTKAKVPSSSGPKRWRRLPEEYDNPKQKKAMERFAQFMMDSRMTKVILLFGVSNHNRFLDNSNRDASLFRIESCGNLDPTAKISQTLVRVPLSPPQWTRSSKISVTSPLTITEATDPDCPQVLREFACLSNTMIVSCH
jgi:hypothetical protein